MIRINLLPPEDRVKKREFRLPEMSTVYMVASISVVIAAVLVVGFMQKYKVGNLENKIEVAKEEQKKLAPQLAKIKQITKEREEVNRRLNLITSLDMYRYFRVKFLNEVSFKLPKNCWLTDIKELSPNMFSMDGIAFSNYTVADIMTNFEVSQVFSSVDLRFAERGEIKERKVMKFGLSANTIPQ